MSKPDLTTLRDEANRLGDAFDAACKPHYVDGRWGYYRAVECDHDIPKGLNAAFDAYHTALHAFYFARDGERGFLGSKGL